jgi:hypothetical protein
VTLRLQQLVTGWQGAEHNQPLVDLHQEYLNNNGAAGSEQGANGSSPNGTRASRRAKAPLTSREQLNARPKSREN